MDPQLYVEFFLRRDRRKEVEDDTVLDVMEREFAAKVSPEVAFDHAIDVKDPKSVVPYNTAAHMLFVSLSRNACLTRMALAKGKGD